MPEKKPYYIYDEESVSYVEEKVTTGRIIKRVILYLIGGLLVAAGVMAFLYYGIDTQETSELKSQKQALESYMVKARAENKELRERVIALEQQDIALRERILGVKEGEDVRKNPDTLKAISSSPESAEAILAEIDSLIKQQEKDYAEVLRGLVKNEEKLTHIPAIKPVKGEILAFFGMRTHPALKVLQHHDGIDFEAREGTKVFATGDGKVTFAGNKRRSHQGNLIVLDHGDKLETRYAHLSDFAVKKGQKVKRGDLIGYSGRPSNGKGPCLHYEVLIDGKHVDPLNYLFREYDSQGILDLKKKAQLEGESMD